jgi:spore coat polysaccharide biosynthesis protein SpsF
MIVAIVQARMGSTRLPGKVLKSVAGVPLLSLQLDRIGSAKMIDRLVVATSTVSIDDQISDFCEKRDILCFRGSEDDVLDRYYHAAKKYRAEVIVRLTADCPLIDPVIIDQAIALFQQSDVDYVSNTLPLESSTYPDGSDVEVFSSSALARVFAEAVSKSNREHVTSYFLREGGEGRFRVKQMVNHKNWASYRFTIDYPEDFEVLELIMEKLDGRKQFGHLGQIVQLLNDYPEIASKNSCYSLKISESN